MRYKPCGRFRIVRQADGTYDVWQRYTHLWLLHRWRLIGASRSYDHAVGIAYAAVAETRQPCIIDYYE